MAAVRQVEELTKTETTNNRLDATGGPSPESEADRDLRKVRQAAGYLWQGRWFVTKAVIAAVLVAVVVALILPNKYTSSATLLPSGHKGMMGSLASGLGSQLADLGLASAIQGADPGESSQLFPNVLRSRTIGDAVLKQPFSGTYGAMTEPFNLYQYLDQSNPDYAFRDLQRLMDVQQDPRTGIITLGVTTRYPRLSQEIAQAMLAELERYNRERRKTQGTEKVDFIESRLAAVQTELAQAEAALREFRAKNMNFSATTDPDLLEQLGKLERETTIKSELYGMLTQQYEMAKLQAADETPIIQVLDEPLVPVVKSGPSRRLIVLAALFLSAGLATLLILGIRPLLALFPEHKWLNRLARVVLNPTPPPFARLRLRHAGETRG